MPALVYPTGDFTPFTKILSADVNGKFTAITTLLNTTGLDSTNIQVGGVNRNRLASGTANAVVVNSDAGVMTALTPVNNGAIYFNGSGVPSAGALPAASGGTGLGYTPALADAEKVLQVNAAGSALTFDTSPTPPSLKVLAFYTLY